MPNLSAKRSADPPLREPTAAATPESVSRRSVTNVLAIPPVPRIPHRTGLSATSSSLRHRYQCGVYFPLVMYCASMAWTFSGIVLDGVTGDRIVAGTGEPEELPGRYALAGLVDAHSHPTIAVDERGPYLGDGDFGAARLDEYAASGVTVIRDTGGRSQ